MKNKRFCTMQMKKQKYMKQVGLLHRLPSCLPRTSLLTTYKFFTKSHVNFGDVILDQPSNESFSNNIKTVPYSAALALTEPIKGLSSDKLYHD